MGATFEKLVDMALMHEEDKGQKKEVKAEEATQNEKVCPKKGQQQKKGKKNDKVKDKRKCHSCGREGHLAKDCRKRKNACFACGEVGHLITDCPKKQG